jgi:hypothetical protein
MVGLLPRENEYCIMRAQFRTPGFAMLHGSAFALFLPTLTEPIGRSVSRALWQIIWVLSAALILS